MQVSEKEQTPHTFIGVVDRYLNQVAIVFPLWSVLTLVFVVLVVGCTRSLLRRSHLLFPHFHLINEFLGTFGWICTSLEGVVVGAMWSREAGLMLLFIRLLLAPYLFKGAYTSPCSALFDIFKNNDYSKKEFIRFFEILAVQVLASLCAVVYVIRVTWRFLADISDDHFHFNGIEQAYYLQVWSMYGFGIEFFTTAISFSFRFILRESIFRVLLESTLVTYLVYRFSPLSGAMMNPLVALSNLLPWSSLDLPGCIEHAFVFWLAPFMGTFLAISLFRRYSRIKHHVD